MGKVSRRSSPRPGKTGKSGETWRSLQTDSPLQIPFTPSWLLFSSPGAAEGANPEHSGSARAAGFKSLSPGEEGINWGKLEETRETKTIPGKGGKSDSHISRSGTGLEDQALPGHPRAAQDGKAPGRDRENTGRGPGTAGLGFGAFLLGLTSLDRKSVV